MAQPPGRRQAGDAAADDHHIDHGSEFRRHVPMPRYWRFPLRRMTAIMWLRPQPRDTRTDGRFPSTTIHRDLGSDARVCPRLCALPRRRDSAPQSVRAQHGRCSRADRSGACLRRSAAIVRADRRGSHEAPGSRGDRAPGSGRRPDRRPHSERDCRRDQSAPWRAPRCRHQPDRREPRRRRRRLARPLSRRPRLVRLDDEDHRHGRGPWHSAPDQHDGCADHAPAARDDRAAHARAADRAVGRVFSDCDRPRRLGRADHRRRV